MLGLKVGKQLAIWKGKSLVFCRKCDRYARQINLGDELQSSVENLKIYIKNFIAEVWLSAVVPNGRRNDYIQKNIFWWSLATFQFFNFAPRAFWFLTAFAFCNYPLIFCKFQQLRQEYTTVSKLVTDLVVIVSGPLFTREEIQLHRIQFKACNGQPES